MRFSRSFQASPHCLPSPDGGYIAMLTSSAIHVREVASMSTVRETSLPRHLTSPVASLQWSPSSRMLLVASAEEIHVFSACEEEDFRATIRSPVPPAAKLAYAGFGACDTEICVSASLGLKFAVFDIKSSRIVEIANPKFYTAASIQKGLSFRPHTGHLTVLTRVSGKDMISIHHPATKEIQRAWSPDTTDAQGLAWSPDGKWLAVWESAAHGHKVLFHHPDGSLYKTWSGPQVLVPTDAEAKLGPGARLLEFSADSRTLAIGDSSKRICLFNMPSVTESMRLQHPACIVPSETLQVWQEQVGSSGRHFVRATQSIYPSHGRSANTVGSPSGCASMSFDSSSTLLATRLEGASSTVWIWDIAAAELRAVLLFNGNVTRALWHPTVRETLLATCDGSSYTSTVFFWDPLSEGPKTVDFSEHMASGIMQALWLDVPGLDQPSLFVSSTQEYVVASVVEDDGNGSLSWFANAETDDTTQSAQSPGAASEDQGENSELDDTFCFKR